MTRPCLLFLALPLAPAPAFAHKPKAGKEPVALAEKLGQYLPEGAVFSDENGKKVNLRALIGRPAIIVPVFFGCAHECSFQLAGLAEVLGKLERLRPGKDFQVVTVSFDPKDTPKIAAEKKGNYLKAIGRPFPPEAWSFLTGDQGNISSFLSAVGFDVRRDGKEFSHPIALVVVSPAGKIVRYLDGVSFLPFEVLMALTEAAEGRVGSPSRSALLYCYSYDPLKKTYVFNVLKVTAAAVFLFLAAFAAYLRTTAKKLREQA